MSDLVTKNYLEISPNMPLAEIAQIEDLHRRALALFYTNALDPGNPAAVQLAKSVDVPQAGAWGVNVATRMASLKTKPLASLRSSKRFSMPLELRPNLFIAFDNELAQLSAGLELNGEKEAEDASRAGQHRDTGNKNRTQSSLGKEKL